LHYFVTLVAVMVMLILLVWRIGFGVTGMELVGVMPTVQGENHSKLIHVLHENLIHEILVESIWYTQILSW
jgi:hypothetical protein